MASTEFPNPFFNYFLSSNIPPIPVNIGGRVTSYSRMQWLYGLKSGALTTELSAQMIATVGQEMAMHFCKYTRELIWEAVRVEGYADKPSRQKCLWVSQGEENLNYWISQLGLGNNQIVYRVELDGIIHEASDEHLMNDDIPYNLALEKAKKYWDGEITKQLAREILFEGRMRILEQI
ncbi:DUF2441 domain-containing protein [Escherichia coli]|nr:DUF2441 domain-containing protein [Escherichia coli]